MDYSINKEKDKDKDKINESEILNKSNIDVAVKQVKTNNFPDLFSVTIAE